MRGTSLPRLLVTFFACAGLAGVGIPVASAALQNRITTTISDESTVQVPNSVQPKVKLGTDVGPTQEDTPLDMSIRFSMTAAQEAALDQLLADQQNPASPQYHQWLTPAQFAAQFGLSSADIAKVSAWLTSKGFTVTGVGNGGMFISFKGTVGQAQSAFATRIRNISYKGETHFANVTNVSVPSALGGVVEAVTGLHNFRLQPHLHANAVSPKYTSSLTGNHFIAPGDVYTIYDTSSLLNNGITGTGESLAVTGEVDINIADITAFRTAAGLSPVTNLPTTVHANGLDPGPAICTSCDTGPNELDLAESSIDLEWSGAMAPTASIIFVNALCTLPGTGCGVDAMTWAIDNNLAPIVTTSYGSCEVGWGASDIAAMQLLFKQANVQGQTVLAAAGDEGATDCDTGNSSTQTYADATEGLAVDFPGSSPNVTSVGGTQFNEGNTTGTTQYWGSTNGTVGQGSALGYIPEAIWNDISDDFFEGGGGGASAYFTKPAWQQGSGVPNDGARDVPDLSLDAADIHDGFLFCMNVAATNGDCSSGFRNASSDFDTAGGTSFDSQIFGGMLALVEQKIGSRISNANPILYALANNSLYYTPGKTVTTLPSVVFNDVTSGNNSMPCATGSTECSNGGSLGYSAAAGYDEASGWGSPNLYNLANSWNLVSPLSSGTLGSNVSSTTLLASTTSVASGSSITLTATVTGSAGTPTGTVQFYANGVALGTPVTLNSSGVATYTYNATCSALGQQAMSASYSGSTTTYQGSIGPTLPAGQAGLSGGAGISNNGSAVTNPLVVTVTSNACPDFSLSASSTTVTVAAGGTIPPVTITLASINSFTGTVAFTATASSSTGYAPTLTFSPASVTISGNSPTTALTFSGITAELRAPTLPGHMGSGTMLAQHSPSHAPWYAAGSGISAASLLLLLLPRRRRRLGSLLLVLLAVAVIGGAAGCGSSQTGPPTGTTSTNPEAGTYIVTVVGTYTSSSNQTTVHSTTITYNIN